MICAYVTRGTEPFSTDCTQKGTEHGARHAPALSPFAAELWKRALSPYLTVIVIFSDSSGLSCGVWR
jgi:hypothetical protein